MDYGVCCGKEYIKVHNYYKIAGSPSLESAIDFISTSHTLRLAVDFSSILVVVISAFANSHKFFC